MRVEATDPRALLLAMHDYEVPCAVPLLTEEECDGTAEWLLTIAHAVPKSECPDPPPLPFCGTHKALIVQSMTGFFAHWLGTANPPCEGCGTPVELKSVEPIKPADA
jgi:hypothetical protein